LLLKDISTNIEEDLFVEIVSNILKEKNEFSRLPIMDCLVSLYNHKSVAKLQDFVLNTINNLSNDEGWRVRYTVAEKIHEVIFN
jgi:hypothetical protein